MFANHFKKSIKKQNFMASKKIIFLGGIFPKNQISYIQSNSIGVIQNAADSLQKKIIAGINSINSEGLHLINLPFIGSYPNRFKKPFYPKTNQKSGENFTVDGRWFINIPLLKIVSRFLSSLSGLMILKNLDEKIIIVYSAHTPFLAASIICKILFKTKLCIILPDLPEYMGGTGKIYEILKFIDCKIFYRLIKKFDYYVVLTEAMISKIGAEKSKSIVIEGVAEAPENIIDFDRNSAVGKYFLYSGTLAKRYGVIDLLEAFMKIRNPKAELWICGDGDGKNAVVEASKINKKIKYLGQLDREQVFELQKKATILVNPRTPNGEYTKYSFPSKIMEYMSSGRPVIMHKLEGIPEEYSEFYISPKSTDIDSLSECMESTLNINEDQLQRLGTKAMDFIFSEKNPKKQSQKILNLILEKF